MRQICGLTVYILRTKRGRESEIPKLCERHILKPSYTFQVDAVAGEKHPFMAPQTPAGSRPISWRDGARALPSRNRKDPSPLNGRCSCTNLGVCSNGGGVEITDTAIIRNGEGRKRSI